MAQKINFKMGNESSLPDSITSGAVYFTTDGTYGKIWYGDINGAKVNIVPHILDGGSWGQGNCCFVENTSILLDFNGNTKFIQDIQSNDNIIAYDIFTEEFYEAKVQKLIINENTTNLAIVTFDNGKTLEMNEYHPLYTINGFHSITNHNGYKTLNVGDIVKTFDGWSTITNIERYKINIPIITYNLAVKNFDETVDDDTNDTFVANGFVVHNASCST